LAQGRGGRSHATAAGPCSATRSNSAIKLQLRMRALWALVLVLPIEAQLVLPVFPTSTGLTSASGVGLNSTARHAGKADSPSESRFRVVGPHTVCAGDAPQFSGVLPAGDGAGYFFWLAHSRSADPMKDPLVIWLTGGPGCSSTLALLSENGPCRVANATNAYLGSTEKNPWSWTEEANVVWVDQPGSTGFSNGPPVSTEKGVVHHMLKFMQSFYTYFPAFEEVPLFIFGESYAGHYVPAIALGVAQNSIFGKRLKGIGIGNGLVNAWPQLASHPDMAYTGGKSGSLGHGVITKGTFKFMEDRLKPCHERVSECQTSIAKESCAWAFETCVMPQLIPVLDTGRNPYDLRKKCVHHPLCYDFEAEAAFLNDPWVQRSLGLEPPRDWQPCSTFLIFGFVASGDWLARFDHYVSELLRANVQVLVYNGDADYMVDWIGSKRLALERWKRNAMGFCSLDNHARSFGSACLSCRQSGEVLEENRKPVPSIADGIVASRRLLIASRQ